MSDTGVDGVMQGEADDSVIVRVERPGGVFAQHRPEGVDERLPEIGPPAMASTCARKRASFTWLGCPARSQLASCGLTLCRIAPTGRQYTTAM